MYGIILACSIYVREDWKQYLFPKDDKKAVLHDNNTTYLMDESPSLKFDEDTPHQQISDLIVDIINKHSYNPNNIKQKVILLSSTWGGGKSSILLNLQNDRKISRYTFIQMDAWNAPKGEIRKQFLRDIFNTSDFLRTESLSRSYWKNVLSPNYWQTTKRNSLIEKLDTIETKTSAKINPLSLALAFLIIIIFPLYKENQGSNLFTQFIPEVFNVLNYWHLGAMVILLAIIPPLLKLVTSIVFPFWGKIEKYSEYKDDKDFPPHLMRKFWEEYLKSNNKPLIITIDNLDRLSEDGQEEYLDSLYHLIEIVCPKNISIELVVWVIIALDKQSILEKKNNKIELSFFNKLSPYEVALPPLTDISYREMLKRFIRTANIAENKDLSDKLYDIFKYFLEQRFPPMLLTKFKPSSAPRYTVSPRLLKKYINQMILLIHNYKNKNEVVPDSLICGAAVVASAQVFGLEAILEEILRDEYKEKLKGISSGLDQKIAKCSNSNKKYELEDEKISYENELKCLEKWDNLLQIGWGSYKSYVSMFFYQKTLCSEDMIETWLTVNQNHSQTIKEYLEVFGTQIIFREIQNYTMEHLEHWNSTHTEEMIQKLYQLERLQ